MTAPLSREKVRELAEDWVYECVHASAFDLLATADHLYAEVETARGVVERLRAGWVPRKFTGHGARGEYRDMTPAEAGYFAAADRGDD